MHCIFSLGCVRGKFASWAGLKNENLSVIAVIQYLLLAAHLDSLGIISLIPIFPHPAPLVDNLLKQCLLCSLENVSVQA